jgi:hypothetical protein
LYLFGTQDLLKKLVTNATSDKWHCLQIEENEFQEEGLPSLSIDLGRAWPTH